MITWNDISLLAFQYIENINASAYNDVDKVLYITCEVYGLSEDELDSMAPKSANKLIKRMSALMTTKPIGLAKDRIGPYDIIYDPGELTLGQFIELRHFTQDHVQKGHYAMASLSKPKGRKYISEGHPLRADYFLRQPITYVMGSLKKFTDRWEPFLRQYEALFGLDKDMYDQGEQSDRFNQQFGWIYSAATVAEHERITLDDAYGLPIRQALNDLVYLKAKGKYEAEQQRKMSKQLNIK